MGFEPQAQDIIRLLTKLKDIDEQYPAHMLVAQRRSYLKRMTEIGLGIRADHSIRNAAENKKPPHGSSTASTLLETALIVAIVAEAGVMAYFYRDKMADFFRTITTDSRGGEITPPPVIPTSLEVQGVTPSPAITSTSPLTAAAENSAGIIVTATSTPAPGAADEAGTTPEVNPLNSTPDPNGDNGNNGNHYGQTPKPERTKENNGNNNKPPKDDDKPPKEDAKPTKAK